MSELAPCYSCGNVAMAGDAVECVDGVSEKHPKNGNRYCVTFVDSNRRLHLDSMKYPCFSWRFKLISRAPAAGKPEPVKGSPPPFADKELRHWLVYCDGSWSAVSRSGNYQWRRDIDIEWHIPIEAPPPPPVAAEIPLPRRFRAKWFGRPCVGACSSSGAVAFFETGGMANTIHVENENLTDIQWVDETQDEQKYGEFASTNF